MATNLAHRMLTTLCCHSDVVNYRAAGSAGPAVAVLGHAGCTKRFDTVSNAKKAAMFTYF